MNKKQYLIHKINHLIISIEIIHIYYNKNLNQLIQQNIQKNKDIDNYFFLNGYKFIQNYNYKINFIYLILYIYKIYKVLNNNSIQKINIHLIKEYINNKKSKVLKKYIKKFYYNYNKINYYYDYYNYNNEYIYNICINNLYIINKIKQPQGFIFFIKYLLCDENN